MLRLLLLALLLANVGFFAWSQGLLAGYGWAPAQQSEPQRLLRQVQPEAIRLRPAALPAGSGVPVALPGGAASAPLAIESAAAAAASPGLTAPLLSPAGNAVTVTTASSGAGLPAAAQPLAAAPRLCLQSAFYTEAQAAALRSRLQQAVATAATATPPALSASAWLFEPAVEPARWIVYMGRYASQEDLDKKRAQLRQLGINTFEPLINTALAPGFSLGHFASQPEADRALAQAAARGVRTARVLQERPEQRGQRLKLPAADTALRQAVEAIKQPLDRRSLQECSA